MKISTLILILLILIVPLFGDAEDIYEYRHGGEKWAKGVWHDFYYNSGKCETQGTDILVKAGKDMTPFILKSISDRNMDRRRYAISALGYIKDRRAISSLEKILKDKTEKNYFRGDALEAIYVIDSNLGTKYAKEFKLQDNYLKNIAEEIENQKPRLTSYSKCE